MDTKVMGRKNWEVFKMMQGINTQNNTFLLQYNYKDYARQALDNFIKQKIGVSYEILVVDDVSIDRTSEILKEC